MANNDGSLGAADNYDIQKQYFDSIGNAFSQLKYELGRQVGLRPAEDIEGLTLKFLGRPMIQVNHVKYIVADPYTISKVERPRALEFLDYLATELKKRFNTINGSPLNLKKESEHQDIQLYSRLSPDRSWVTGQGMYMPNMCRYMLTSMRVYHVDTADLNR